MIRMHYGPDGSRWAFDRADVRNGVDVRPAGMVERAYTCDAPRQSADDKSRELLEDWLDPCQLAEYRRDNAFTVIGSGGGHYRIRCEAAPYNVDCFDRLDGHRADRDRADDGRVQAKLCFQPVFERPVESAWQMVSQPPADVWLSQKILLETDEPRVWQIANAQERWQIDVYAGVADPRMAVQHVRNADTAGEI